VSGAHPTHPGARGAKRFLLAGGNVFTLQKLLGHTTFAMVRRYIELADVDVKAQHQRFSPVDSLLPMPAPKRYALNPSTSGS
jgi:hypothetical protein